MGLRNQGGGVGGGAEVSLGVVCRALCSSGRLLLFLELLLLQAALLLTKLGPSVLEPYLAEEWIKISVWLKYFMDNFMPLLVTAFPPHFSESLCL